MNALLPSVRERGAAYGLNLLAAIPAVRYDDAVAPNLRAGAIRPTARSIIVLGNGGGDFWRAYRRHAGGNRGWTRRDHPLDDFTRLLVETQIAPALGERGTQYTIVYPFVSEGGSLHFMELARLAGIGGPSLLGVLIHPEYGPWIALRAAFLVDDLIDEAGEAAGFNPCPACVERSCIAACPAGAVGGGGWDVIGCVRHRVEAEPDCSAGCHSRLHCVIGPRHRYPDDELRHHQERALRSMRAYYETHLRK